MRRPLGDGWLLRRTPPGARGTPTYSRSFRVVEPNCLFQFCIERSQSVRRLFLQLCSFVILAGVAHGRPRARVPHLVGASEPIPFPGADSIFSRHCGAISGRLRFAVRPSRAAQLFARSNRSPRKTSRRRARVMASKASDPDQGSPTAAWSGYLFAMSQIGTACPLARESDLARPWMDKGEGAWGSRTRGFLP
jgi:hypothetical protein